VSFRALKVAALALAVPCGAAAVPPGVPSDRLLARVNALPTSESLARWHELLGSEPHIAGTDADWRNIERMRAAFVAMGLETVVEEFDAVLPQPQEGIVEIVGGPAMPAPQAGRRGVISLPVSERNLAEDPATAHPGLTFGWNAFSASGDVTAGVVYANYGTDRDFARLREWGIDCKGKVVLARYGGNFRGYKARFAEDAGAAALIIFTDPADGGFAKGKVWPEGGWANDTCVQRGSVVTGSQPGDPRTPMRPSVPGGPGLDESSMDLPRIPVQPIGYAAAAEIVRRMEGKPVPADSGWTGGLQFPYALEGGPALQVRVKVTQDRKVRRTANVVATLRGAVHPDEQVIIGCHHDAWCFGAADPLAGTIALMESARAFADAARRGDRPARTLVFCAWGAEEYGIFGSTEFVEAHRGRLTRDAVGYINLDMAAMGPNFGGSCSPSLRDVLLGAAVRVPQARGADGETVYDRLSAGGSREPQFGDIGGGSDHVGFNCHAGVPCAGLGSGGAEGTSYHSNYDTIAWYRATVGADYAPALMITRMTNALACALADAPIVPLSAARHGIEGRRLLSQLRGRATDPATTAAIDALIGRAQRLAEAGGRLDASIGTLSAQLPVGSKDPARIAATARIDRALMAIDRAWLDPRGLQDRPWYRSLLAATDRNNGYAPTMLPLLAEALQDGPADAVNAAIDRYRAAFDRLDQAVAEADEAVRALDAPRPGAAAAGALPGRGS